MRPATQPIVRLALLAVGLLTSPLQPALSQPASPTGSGLSQLRAEPEPLRARAKAGEAAAQYALASYLLSQGRGQLSTAEALRWLRKAAEQGHAEAQSDLGIAYLRGVHVNKDSGEGAGWLRKAAQQGQAGAQADLGLLYYQGDGVPRDREKAAYWYRKASEQENARAQYNLASLLATGDGVTEDDAEAARLYRRAAGQGLVEAQYALGVQYLNGEGVPRDLDEATKWFRSAAALGYASAQYVLARQYEKGLGVKPDQGEALRWYREAAELGHPEAQADLASRYFRANRDSSEVVRWYRFAAEQGLPRAQNLLGLFYQRGWGGLEADPVRAQKWFILAASRSTGDDQAAFSEDRDLAAKQATQAQLAEAQRLAANWNQKEWTNLRHELSTGVIRLEESTGVDHFFGSAGRSINAARDEYSQYWQPHLEASRRRILEAAALVANRESVLVLGAGRCHEIPLEELAAQFDRVILVDLDEPSMREALAGVRQDLRHKLELRISDVTSFAEPLMEESRQVISGASTAEEAITNLGSLYGRLSELKRAPDLPSADLVISSLVLSELPRYPSTYAARLIEDQFQAKLSEWPGYGGLWRSLRTHAMEDHAALLAQLCRTGGIVYYADTVARGPDLSAVTRDQREAALRELAGRLTATGVFQHLSERPQSWALLKTVFTKLADGKGANGGPSDPSLEQVVSRLASDPGSIIHHAGLAAEAAVRLLCQQHLPAEMEIGAYESMISTYFDAAPTSMEELVDQERWLQALRSEGLQPSARPEGWWWLEYACSIPRKAGGFRVSSWILAPGISASGDPAE